MFSLLCSGFSVVAASEGYSLVEVCGLLIAAACGAQFSSVSVKSLSHVWLFVTPWTAASQASLSIANSWSLLKLVSIEPVMPSSHLILCHPLLLSPSIFHQGLFKWVSSSHQVALVLEFPASASVLPMNTQDWSPLGLTGWISLQSTGLSRVFSNTTVQKHQFFGAQLSL